MNQEIVKNIKKIRPKMFLFGMPGSHSSFFEMNIAQLPQGPGLNLAASFPKKIRSRINSLFINIFNPDKKAPYMGLRLIQQNLSQYIDFSILEYPKDDEDVLCFLRTSEDVACIGISIGCENRVYQARDLSRKIRTEFPSAKIIFGNYGAVAGKKLGILTEEDGKVLWDSEEERELKKLNGQDFFSGEGVHDVRLWFRENGVDAGEPDAPLLSRAIPDPDIYPESRIVKFLMEKTGFIPMPNDQNKIGVSIGCTNNCSFCNTRFKFNRSKTFLYRKAEDIFHEMERVYDINLNSAKSPPESLFFLMDENFMKDENVKSGDGRVNFLDVAERLCELIEHSGKNIHWGTFSDVKSLMGYKERKGSFAGLVRGGLQSVWVGLESKEDVFNKRGGASTEEVEEMISEVQSYGISIIGSFIPGLSVHTEKKSVKRFDSLRELKSGIEEDISGSLNLWFTQKKRDLLKIFDQLLYYGNKKELKKILEAVESDQTKSEVMGIVSRYQEGFDAPGDLVKNCEESVLLAFRSILQCKKGAFLELVREVLTKDRYESLNIWEDVDWWIKQNTGCRQVMMYSITGVVGNHDYMIRLSDYDFGHREIPGNNDSDIPGTRLEIIDRRARDMFYQQNGPVVLSSLLVFWGGFIKLKDSDNPAELRAATYYYWMAKRYMQQVSLATIFFNSLLFTKCSDRFLGRLARMFNEFETIKPKESELHEKYNRVFETYDSKVWGGAKWLAKKMRKSFIKKYLEFSRVSCSKSKGETSCP